jgi:hypothetical protein
MSNISKNKLKLKINQSYISITKVKKIAVILVLKAIIIVPTIVK